MGEIVNLRQARKRAARRAKETAAEANRATFGLPSAVKAKARRDNSRRDAALDAHRLDKPSKATGESSD